MCSKHLLSFGLVGALFVAFAGCSSSSSSPDSTAKDGGGTDAPVTGGGACKLHPDQATYPGGYCCPAGETPPGSCVRAGAFDGKCTEVGLSPQAYKCGGTGPGVDCTITHPACKYSTDCSSSEGCNTKTGRCYSYTGNCVGTPCTYSTDCPTNEHCNSAESACQAN